MTWLAQSTNQPYYPGFRDLNLFVVAICLVLFLYVIAMAATAYRVRMAKARLAEIATLLERDLSDDQRQVLEADRARYQRDYDVLTSSAPGKWFR